MTPRDLIRLCYISEAALPEESPGDAIEAILGRSRWWNEKVGITGALFFNRNLFSQVLEGPNGEVERLFEQIRRDPRHRNVIRIDWRMINSRQFPEWSMAFVGTDRRERHRFKTLLLDEQREANVVRDGMLNLLVNIVRNREQGLHTSRHVDRVAEALRAPPA